jgi:hypothetical protein
MGRLFKRTVILFTWSVFRVSINIAMYLEALDGCYWSSMWLFFTSVNANMQLYEFGCDYVAIYKGHIVY